MSDISNSACRASKITALNNRELYKDDNGLFITVQTSFLDGIRLGNGVDILIFNPPYVPTEFEEIPSEAATIASAWAGGTDGMDVTSTLLNQLKVRSDLYIYINNSFMDRIYFHKTEYFTWLQLLAISYTLFVKYCKRMGLLLMRL